MLLVLEHKRLTHKTKQMKIEREKKRLKSVVVSVLLLSVSQVNVETFFFLVSVLLATEVKPEERL